MKRNIVLIILSLSLVFGLAACEREGKQGGDDFIQITLVNNSNKTVDLVFANENISNNTKVAAGQSRTERRRLEHVRNIQFRAVDQGKTIATKSCQYFEHQTSFRVTVNFDGKQLSCGQGW